MQEKSIVIPVLSKNNFSAWVAAIRLQAGDLGLLQAIDDPSFTADPLLIRVLASLTNSVLNAMPPDAQREAIHGNPK